MAKDGDGGGCGCVGLIVSILILWALLFGVTVGGRHYGLSCSTARGVEVHWGDPADAAPDYAPPPAPERAPQPGPAESPVPPGEPK